MGRATGRKAQQAEKARRDGRPKLVAGADGYAYHAAMQAAQAEFDALCDRLGWVRSSALAQQRSAEHAKRREVEGGARRATAHARLRAHMTADVTPVHEAA